MQTLLATLLLMTAVWFVARRTIRTFAARPKGGGCGNCGCANNACVVNNTASVTCFDNDVYWQDCNGNFSALKTACGGCGCIAGACRVEPHAATTCVGSDVYWQDCNGATTDKKAAVAEAEALVPEKFKAVHFTRLASGEVTPEFAARLRELVGGRRT